MNYLAHLFLSQQNTDLMIGNFIADHVKGKEVQSFKESIQRGIQMHRDIDHYTDHHTLVAKSKERLYPKYGKYASVIVDMFYDHILAKNWGNYSPLPLKTFAASIYRILKINYILLPNRAQLMLNYMSTQDWLSSYATIEGMGKALNGLSRRASFDSGMEQSIVDLKRDFDLYEAEFTPFFKELFEYCANWK